ncbi:MAG: di-trans,poly-cis-decaprenylcistransferase [Candidatus Thermoplasmatota archaeon]|nr:di-trans,poly-cis-decaprenylcistransferase [Candidatus Thermoplasmatota archaeon]MBU1940828.1 di-trans,poly-cis-decaprenylcistransferase [Candidatus Thermoplasmatota archaeon]
MGVGPISQIKPSLKSLANKKIADFEDFALKSSLGRRIVTAFYQSNLYRFISDKINDFRNLKLKEEIKRDEVPEHIAIIMDGNRRFANALGLPLEQGHFLGKDRIENVLDWCFELGVKVLTVYAFSTENFNRSNSEVQTLMQLCNTELDRAQKDSRIHKNRVRVRVIGQLDALPMDIRESATNIMDLTEEYDKYYFNIALAYGGREEIVQAIKRIAEDVKLGDLNLDEISPSTVSTYMYTNGLPDPDLILRTSGEERISNFLLWQLAYSELYFSDVYWPAFQKRDFLKAVRTYQQRKRRFGK